MRGLAVVAKQRTGTNFLRSLIAQSTNAHDCGEIFHTETLKAPANFFSWLASTGRAFPAIRSEDWARQVLSDYLDWAEATFGVLLLDVKYNSLWAVVPTWFSPLDTPPVIRVLNQRGYRFLHIERTNRLDHAMSHLIASRTGVFVTREAVEITERYVIEPDRVAAMIEQYERELKFMQRYLGRMRKRADTTYEALAGADDATLEAELRRLIAGTDVRFRALKPPRTKKILRDWRANVANLAEIEARFGAG